MDRWEQLKIILLNFNIFHNAQSLNDEWEITTQRISTRVFFFFLTITVIILFTYTAISTDVMRETISRPSLTIYESLLIHYPDSLECPCSQTSITYGSFISVKPKFHPVCQSDFISRDWIEFLFNYNESYFLNVDFRVAGSSQFQLLAALCQLSNASFDLAQTNIIDASTLISVQLISPNNLLAQAQALIKQFRLVSPNSFVRTINLIRGITAGNKLVPIIPTLYAHQVLQIYLNGEMQIVHNHGMYFNEQGLSCYCDSQPTCSSPSAFYQNQTYNLQWYYYLALLNPVVVPGFFTGCYALEALLQSTLECFFNQTCVDFVQVNVKPFETSNFTAIDSNSMTLFTPTWTIENITAQLMVDQWNSSISYQKYFEQCQPLLCTFLRARKHNSLYIVTKLIGLIGGLVTAFQLLVPIMVDFIRRWWNRRKNKQLPNTTREYFKFSFSTHFVFL